MKESDDEVDRNIEELARETLHYTDEGDVHARLLKGSSEDEPLPESGVSTNEVRITYSNLNHFPQMKFESRFMD